MSSNSQIEKKYLAFRGSLQTFVVSTYEVRIRGNTSYLNLEGLGLSPASTRLSCLCLYLLWIYWL